MESRGTKLSVFPQVCTRHEPSPLSFMVIFNSPSSPSAGNWVRSINYRVMPDLQPAAKPPSAHPELNIDLDLLSQKLFARISPDLQAMLQSSVASAVASALSTITPLRIEAPTSSRIGGVREGARQPSPIHSHAEEDDGQSSEFDGEAARNPHSDDEQDGSDCRHWPHQRGEQRYGEDPASEDDQGSEPDTDGDDASSLLLEPLLIR